VTLDEFAEACLWERAICLECEHVFDPDERLAECPACGSDAVFLARDLEQIEAWLATLPAKL